MSDILIDEDSNLVRHARAELSRTNNDAEFVDSIVNAVAAFAKYGHSGGSASAGIEILHDLLMYKNLTPLTNDPNEWMSVYDGDPSADPPELPVWQSCRNPEVFSNNGGKTHYILSERVRVTSSEGDSFIDTYYTSEEKQ